MKFDLRIFISVQRSSTGVKKRPNKDENEKLEIFLEVDAPHGWRKCDTPVRALVLDVSDPEDGRLVDGANPHTAFVRYRPTNET